MAKRLVIPSIGIDAPVQPSQTIPYTDQPLAGCPARPQDTETLVVPDHAIATPADSEAGLENKIWIFGHSRLSNQPQLFYGLQDVNLGDELFIDGVDKGTGEQIAHQRFVVNGIYLADDDSGETLLNAARPQDIPRLPEVVLQTSVREDGPGKQWLFDRDKLTAKAKNIVQGDLNDPCKYLLLFVVAGSG